MPYLFGPSNKQKYFESKYYTFFSPKLITVLQFMIMSDNKAFDSLNASSTEPCDHQREDIKNPPITINGDKQIAIKPICHEKYKHIAQETSKPATLSKTTA